jgi:hypothetical protein
MPVSGGASSSHPQAPTHHQLDELDALMQRMLALPVDQGDSASDPPAELVAAPEKRDYFAQSSTEIPEVSNVAATPITDQAYRPQADESRFTLAEPQTMAAQAMVEDSGDQSEIGSDLETKPWSFPALAPTAPGSIEGASPLSEWENLQRKNREVDATDSKEESSPVVLTEEPLVKLATVSTIESERISFPGMRPLLLINWGYDCIVGLLGSKGLWLRSMAGRNLLGLLGLILAVGSVAWLLWGMMAWNW